MALLCLAGASCAPSDEDDPGAEPIDRRAPLGAEALLVRASLDLRGVRPSVGELDAVRRDPAAVDEMIAGFVDDPAFGERMKDVFAGAWRTRVDIHPLPDQPYDRRYEDPRHVAIGEEPLDLVAFVALNDRPFTEILRSEVTYVDPVLLELWPLEEAPGDPSEVLPPGTVRARYTDGRPHAGVLSSNAVFWRHSSTVENANRGRANALSQALLCQSYLDRPIDFPTDLDLTDSESIWHAIATNAACQGCHSTLDPLASYLWGYMYPDAEIPQPGYEVDQERAWQVQTGAPPGFFGEPGERLEDLADHVAGDERFVSCTVRRVYESMMGRKAELQDEGALAEHREAFLAGGLTLSSLVRSVLTDPSYRGESWTPRFGGSPQAVHEKVAPVRVLGHSIAALTGYELRFSGRPATELDVALRRLAGGSDRGDTTEVSTGAVLVQRRLAEAGAMHAVNAAAEGRAGGGSLDGWLGGVDLQARPTPEQLSELVLRVRSAHVAADDPEIEAMLEIWDDVAAIAPDPTQAWIAVLTAVLADPDHLLY